MVNLRLVVSLAVVALGSREASFRALEKTSIHEGLNTLVIRADQWLRDHPEPDQAGMDELKATNPEAFAIVQALLTKKSLGLLNPKRPNAFGGYSETPVSMPEAAQTASEVALPTVAVEMESSHSHKNFLNWRPHDDDEEAVADELQHAGSQPQPRKAEMVSIKSGIATTASVGNKYLADMGQEPAVAVDPKPKAPTASMSQENTYLKSLGVPTNSNKKENPNALTSFSWDDTPKAASDISMQEGPKTSVAPQRSNPLTSSPLSNWLR